MAQTALFTNEMVGGRAIHIVGAGSLGGKLFLNLVRKRICNLHLWDDDIVKKHNLFNQPYYGEDVSAAKVLAALRIAVAIDEDAGSRITVRPERVTPNTQLSGIVLIAVDSNEKRYKQVWPCVKRNEAVSFFADGRVGLDGGKAYGLDPRNDWHIEQYESELHNHQDPEQLIQGCKTEFAMPENSDRVAAEMLWRLTRWVHFEAGSPDPYMNHISWCYTPTYAEAHEYWDVEDEEAAPEA